MADDPAKKPVQVFDVMQMQKQLREMRVLELGEAQSKGDHERGNELQRELQHHYGTSANYEGLNADRAFGQFERDEAERAARDEEKAFFESARPGRAPEGDPQKEPEQDPRQQQAQTPERQAEATPERVQEQDSQRRPIGPYDEMKQQHAEIVAKNSPQEQGQAEEKQLKFSEDRQQQSPEIAGTQQPAEPGEKQLRFSEDREPRGNSLDHNEERSDAKQAERPESGEKKLSFFEDKNPGQPNDIEH